MQITPEFLRMIQAQGWMIVRITGEAATVACPRADCNLRVALKPGADVPPACRKDPALPIITITCNEDFRHAMLDRREALYLTQKEVAAGAGLDDDHVAKCEKDNPSRLPNLDTATSWAGAVGYTLALIPTTIPPLMLRTIAETRERSDRRLKHFRQFGRLRKGRGAA